MAPISSEVKRKMSKVTRLSLFLAVLTGLAVAMLPPGPAEAQWALVARKAMGRIQHMRAEHEQGKPTYDFATVLLEAPADKVFATTLDLARKNTQVRIVMQDPHARRLQLAEGDRTATLTVVPFSDDVSQLMIGGQAGPGEDSTTSRVVQAVMRVCERMNKKCEVGG
jgi:hypothetical protein